MPNIKSLQYKTLHSSQLNYCEFWNDGIFPKTNPMRDRLKIWDHIFNRYSIEFDLQFSKNVFFLIAYFSSLFGFDHRKHWFITDVENVRFQMKCSIWTPISWVNVSNIRSSDEYYQLHKSTFDIDINEIESEMCLATI